jgi:glycosyltransferase involved in cell wall biosynthesis
MKENKPKFIALIPAYNEEARITGVVRGASLHLPVLVVDDGSKDETAHLAKKAGAEVISYQPNRGKGAALRVGFKKAMEMGVSAVLTLDADGQHDPDEIPLFLDAYATGVSKLIIGARDFSRMPFIRKIANTLGGRMISWAAGQEILDNQSGYRLISSQVMQAMLKSMESGFEFEVEMVMTCLRNGWSLGWVPIRTIYSNEGSHIHPVRHFLNFMRMIWQIRREMRS